jgi:CubicO group peptidase (beta-lactamase class C family)
MAALYHQESVLSSSSLAEMLSIPETVLQDPDGGRYGLGVADYTDLLGVHAIGHTGSSPGYSAAALYLPEDGIVAVWLINTGEGPDQLAGQIMGRAWSSIADVLVTNRR